MPGVRVAEGERVTLRTTGREDMALHARLNNPDLRGPMGTPVTNQPGLEAFIEEDFGDATPLVICLDGEGTGPGPADAADVERIGVTSVEDNGRYRPELSYFLLPEYQGEGYGTEAVSLSVDIAFQEHHHPAVEAKTLADNEASRGLLESLGFTQEGRIHSYVYWDGQYRDFVLYSLLQEDWHDRD